MSKDLVSIIMPCYNGARFIGDSIRSVLDQSHKDWELIVVDDGSTDDSIELVRSYTDPRIKLFTSKQNLGAAGARNLGLDNANGHWVAFLDCDDLWLPNKLETQLRFAVEKNASILFSSYDLINENGLSMNYNVQVQKEWLTFHDMLKFNQMGCLTVVYDFEKFKTLRFNYPKREDWAMWLQLMKNGERAFGVKEVLAHYRVYSNSSSSNKVKMALESWGVLRKYVGLNPIKAAYYFQFYIFNSLKKLFRS